MLLKVFSFRYLFSPENQLHLKEQPFLNFTQIIMIPFRHILSDGFMVELFRKYRFTKAVRRTKNMLNVVPAVYFSSCLNENIVSL